MTSAAPLLLLAALAVVACASAPSSKPEASTGGAAGAPAANGGAGGAEAVGGAAGDHGWAPACALHVAQSEVEEHILLPKCSLAGDGTCHGGGRVSPALLEVGSMADGVLDKRPMFSCQRDFLVSSEHPERSHLLAKIRARGASARCADGSEGGPSMPYQDAPQLTDEEAACIEWWVYAITADAR